MSRILVGAPGFQTTVQDLGRFGYAHLGVSASGAADGLALRAGNLLVGNAENAAALEMTLTGGEFQFEGDAVVALTGSDFGAPIPMWTAVAVRAGQSLRLGGAKAGARCYLAARGGIAAPAVLGSASVHIFSGVGGRPLRAGDALPIGRGAIRRAKVGWSVAPPSADRVLRTIAGPHADWFGDDLYSTRYQVTEASNRMGLRLKGAPLPAPSGRMITEGAALGAVQVTPDGQPVVLFVEHQTTGGYPKPANVISADFWRLGQLRPRDEVRFERVTIERALELLREQERWLHSLL